MKLKVSYHETKSFKGETPSFIIRNFEFQNRLFLKNKLPPKKRPIFHPQKNPDILKRHRDFQLEPITDRINQAF